MQAVAAQKFSSGRRRPIKLEMHARLRRMRSRIGHVEHAGRQHELTARWQIGGRFVDRDDRVASDNVDVEIGIAQRRQTVHRPQHATRRQSINRNSIVGNRRAAGLERIERRVDGNHNALDGAAQEVFVEPAAHLRHDENRPNPFQRSDRHPRAGKTGRQA